MSKSLGNAIGIHEPAPEMFGKLMSISDDLMWRYWLLLTDLRQSEIDAMRLEIQQQRLHPMDAKKRLARTITAGFHGEEAAAKAEENWVAQFQRREVADDLEEFHALFSDLGETVSVSGKSLLRIRVDKLLVKAGLATSGSEATRLNKSNSVKFFELPGAPNVFPGFVPSIEIDAELPVSFVVRVGKRAKRIILA